MTGDDAVTRAGRWAAALAGYLARRDLAASAALPARDGEPDHDGSRRAPKLARRGGGAVRRVVVVAPAVPAPIGTTVVVPLAEFVSALRAATREVGGGDP